MPTASAIEQAKFNISQLSAKWAGTTNLALRALYHAQAVTIGAAIGATYNPGTGVWTYPAPDVAKDHPVQISTAHANSVTAQPTGIVHASTTAAAADIERRRQYVSSLVFSNDPDVASIQQQSADIFIQTGRWDSPEQQQLHAKAEQIRSSDNPLYPGSETGAGENMFILPTNQFPTSDKLQGGASDLIKNTLTGANSNSLVTAAVGVGFLALVFSLFRGR